MDNFKHKKSLGQNFLKDETILNKIVNAIDLQENDLIIEIGPGQGALTRKLQEKNVNLICYEIDERTKPFLEKIKTDKTNIIFNDFLKVDVCEDIKDYKYNNLYVIANLPYYITTPIITKIIESKIPIKAMVLMVQKEVADRFLAQSHSKDYGYFTLYLKYYFDISRVTNVPKTAFNPAPKVDSAVVKLVKRNNQLNIDEQAYLQFLKDCFKQKRKTLKNNLSRYDWDKIKEVLVENELAENIRAEELDEELLIKIFQKTN